MKYTFLLMILTYDINPIKISYIWYLTICISTINTIMIGTTMNLFFPGTWFWSFIWLFIVFFTYYILFYGVIFYHYIFSYYIILSDYRKYGLVPLAEKRRKTIVVEQNYNIKLYRTCVLNNSFALQLKFWFSRYLILAIWSKYNYKKKNSIINKISMHYFNQVLLLVFRATHCCCAISSQTSFRTLHTVLDCGNHRSNSKNIN